jgi:hypothetical protein
VECEGQIHSRGHVVSRQGISEDNNRVLVTAPSAPGLSGGACFNAYGFLLGHIRGQNKHSGGIRTGADAPEVSMHVYVDVHDPSMNLE